MKPCISSGRQVEDEEEEEEEEGASCLASELTTSAGAWVSSPVGADFFSSATFLRTAALYRLDDLLLLKTSCSTLAAADWSSLLLGGEAGGAKR